MSDKSLPVPAVSTALDIKGPATPEETQRQELTEQITNAVWRYLAETAIRELAPRQPEIARIIDRTLDGYAHTKRLPSPGEIGASDVDRAVAQLREMHQQGRTEMAGAARAQEIKRQRIRTLICNMKPAPEAEMLAALLEQGFLDVWFADYTATQRELYRVTES